MSKLLQHIDRRAQHALHWVFTVFKHRAGIKGNTKKQTQSQWSSEIMRIIKQIRAWIDCQMTDRLNTTNMAEDNVYVVANEWICSYDFWWSMCWTFSVWCFIVIAWSAELSFQPTDSLDPQLPDVCHKIFSTTHTNLWTAVNLPQMFKQR